MGTLLEEAGWIAVLFQAQQPDSTPARPVI